MSDHLMYLCAECGSPSLEFSVLVGGDASCKACGWSGRREGLTAIPVQQDGLADADQTFLVMYNDFRRVFRTVATPLVQLLVKWGFVAAVQRGERVEVVEPEKAVRYVNRMFQGALKALLEARQDYEKEKVDDRRANA